MKKSIRLLNTTLAAVSPLSGLAAQKMPNIVLILADDMGWGDAGFNGCTEFPTPAIDAIAAGGARFSEGYVMAPQCAPSRAALLTGKDQNSILANSNVTMDIIGTRAPRRRQPAACAYRQGGGAGPGVELHVYPLAK